MLAPVKVGGRVMSWCAGCLIFFLFLFWLVFLLVILSFFPYICFCFLQLPEPDDIMSISAMDGTECCIVFLYF